MNDDIDKILEESIKKITTKYVNEQEEQQDNEEQQDKEDEEVQYGEEETPEEAPTGVGLDQTGQPDPMGAQGIPGPAMQQPETPEIKLLDVDKVAPDPNKINVKQNPNKDTKEV